MDEKKIRILNEENGKEFILTKGIDNDSLLLFEKENWEHVLELLQKLPLTSRAAREFKRLIQGSACEVVVEENHEITLSSVFRCWVTGDDDDAQLQIVSTEGFTDREIMKQASYVIRKKSPVLAVTGDTHGEEGRFIYPGMGFETLTEKDYLFVVGDFQYVWDDSFWERKYRKMMAEKPYTICFVDGNHENFDLLEQYPVEMWNGGKVHVIERDENGKPKVIHLMRGQVFEIAGKKIFTFGGGYSLDRDTRIPHRTWWPQEMVTDEDKVEAIKNLERHGNCVDYILTHTLPLYAMCNYYHYHYKEKPLNNFLQWVREKIQYKHWYVGHLHLDEDVKSDKTITVMLFDVRNMETNEILIKEEDE